MIGKSDRQSVGFLDWEQRCRGFQLWNHPVAPEPPFVPFLGHGMLVESTALDDGRKPTFLSSLIERVSERLAPRTPHVEHSEEEERPPKRLERGELVEFQAHLPAGVKFDPRACSDFFVSLRSCREPIAFEIIATGSRMRAQFAIHPADQNIFGRQLECFFPDVPFLRVDGFLESAWGELEQTHARAVEFGLGKEFVIPLSSTRGEPFVGLAGALSGLADGEAAVFQVIFAAVSAPWRESAMRSVTHGDGSAYFVNAPELLSGAKEKFELPLYATVVRLAARSRDEDRTWQILCDAGAALGVYGSTRGNELIPLGNDGYPDDEHEQDVVRRQSRRSGMMLNAEELAGFVHLPSGDVKSPKLRQTDEKSKASPNIVRNPSGLRLGTNVHAGLETPVVVSDDVRVRHFHVIGASGTGKSTFLFNLIRQDVEKGAGCSVLDPHGDLIDKVLGMIPEHRIGDVVLLDPSDAESSVGFNVLKAHSDWERNLLAADLVAVFRRLSTSWGDQLNSVLSNALLAFLESDRGGTLLDVRRFLLEPAFRSDFLKTVRDPNVGYYWRQAFPALTGNKSVGPVVTRLDTFLSPKPIRYMVAQRENRIDFGDILGSGKIFLAKLPEGLIGKENSYLLGSLIVSKIQAAAMARQRESEASRRYHTLFADEFHNFLTPSLAECLSGVRKYRLGLVLAHQEMRQVDRDPDVASSLLNAGTRVVFRVNDRDARSLESGFSAFDARDIQNLEIGRAICRVERSDWDFNLAVDVPSKPEEGLAKARREQVVAAARKSYGTPSKEIEGELKVLFEAGAPAARGERKAELPKAPVAKSLEPVVPAPVAAPEQTIGTKAPDFMPPQPAMPRAEEKKGEKVTVPSIDLGKGGAQHKAIQERIKEEAEKLGFRVVVEKEILGGAGQVDLVLARDDLEIACEVTVTTTIDHEVGNVAKCIKAGFTRIAVIAVAEDRLAKLTSAVANSLGAEAAQRTRYYLPEAFIGSLQDLRPSEAAPRQPETRTRGGRVVRRVVATLSRQEATEKEEHALKLMADLMNKRRRSG